MPVHDDLGLRMKDYENKAKMTLKKKVPVAIRIDGKAFHTFTRGFKKPFDTILIHSMQETMKYLCENIQGCVFGYTQSDEITLILIDYQNENSQGWFDYKVQKMCSIAASMATIAFNKFFSENAGKFYRSIWDEAVEDWSIDTTEEDIEYCATLSLAARKGAMFDARCFSIPKDEVANLIYWRQLDAIRNSVQMVGQANFSHKELHSKTCNDIRGMLMSQKDIDWSKLPIHQQRGSCCIKRLLQNGNVEIKDGVYTRLKWVIDTEIPLFKDNGREYIEKTIYVGEENCDE